MKKCIVAEPHILQEHGCFITQESVIKLTSEINPTVLEHRPSGWRFHSFHRHIINDEETSAFLYQVKSYLKQLFPSSISEDSFVKGDRLDVNNHKLRTPPMLFASDLMKLELQSSNFSISVDAGDALFCWIVKHTAESISNQGLDVPKALYAEKWQKNLVKDFSNGASEATNVLFDLKPIDWTYTTDYCGTILLENESIKHILHGNALNGSIHYEICPEIFDNRTGKSFQTHPTSSSCIDYDMLKRRDIPILFYDELMLYGDDLEDCGEVSVEAKIRVMPNCWFLLIKYFLRVDQVVAKCRETRMFHKFDEKGLIHMEVIWREQLLDSNSSTPPILVPPATKGPQSNAIQIKPKPTIENSSNLPIVNETYRVQQYYTLQF